MASNYWRLHDSITLPPVEGPINIVIDFMSGEATYNNFIVTVDGLTYDSTTVYTSSGWADDKYKLVRFKTNPTGVLFIWLQNNAESVDLTNYISWYDGPTIDKAVSKIVDHDEYSEKKVLVSDGIGSAWESAAIKPEDIVSTGGAVNDVLKLGSSLTPAWSAIREFPSAVSTSTSCVTRTSGCSLVPAGTVFYRFGPICCLYLRITSSSAISSDDIFTGQLWNELGGVATIPPYAVTSSAYYSTRALIGRINTDGEIVIRNTKGDSFTPSKGLSFSFVWIDNRVDNV